jgi:hydroxymethylbilane synthase
MSTAPFLRIGTRGSPLALWQARTVQTALARAHDIAPGRIEIVVIKTTGDKVLDRPLAEVGGKGLFTQEIERALLDGGIDLAVHSAKDVPTFLPDGLILAGCLPRADSRDALVSPRYKTLVGLPEGALVGTASVRRMALLRRLRPDIKLTLLRGNVETRLRKVEEGEVDATLLAIAGLIRLDLYHRASEIFHPDVFPPALGQGVVTIEARADNKMALAAVERINHAQTSLVLTAERAVLAVLDGSCRTPIAGGAIIREGHLSMHAIVYAPEGKQCWSAAAEGPAGDALAIGTRLGAILKPRVPPEILMDK